MPTITHDLPKRRSSPELCVNTPTPTYCNLITELQKGPNLPIFDDTRGGSFHV